MNNKPALKLLLGTISILWSFFFGLTLTVVFFTAVSQYAANIPAMLEVLSSSCGTLAQGLLFVVGIGLIGDRVWVQRLASYVCRLAVAAAGLGILHFVLFKGTGLDVVVVLASSLPIIGYFAAQKALRS